MESLKEEQKVSLQYKLWNVKKIHLDSKMSPVAVNVILLKNKSTWLIASPTWVTINIV